jgi:hypothetical protein
MVVRVDVFAVRTAREIDVLHEHVAWVNLVPLACVRTTTTAAAEVARAIIAITAIITPTWVVGHGAPPSNDSV